MKSKMFFDIYKGLTLFKVFPYLFLVFFQLNVVVYAESPNITLDKLAQKRTTILETAQQFNINPLYLAAVIYTERTLNYDLTDEWFDIPLAKANKNSSIGFCQVKLKTAYFIERQFHNQESLYYPSEQYQNLLQVSSSPQELINKLANDDTNIQYAAAYLKLMEVRWHNAGFSIKERPDILGTLYSAGLFHNDGTERLPNSNPQPNEFGSIVIGSILLILPIFKTND